MPEFLIRDYEQDGPGHRSLVAEDLPRSPAESYVPWALTAAGQVVYAKYGEHRGFTRRRGLTQYDTLVSQDRRRLCQSAFGMLALEHLEFTRKAVDAVSDAIRHYLRRHFAQRKDAAVAAVYDGIGHYFFTGGGKGFGRISDVNKKALGPNEVWRQIFDALADGRLEQKLAIHDAVGRKVLPVLGGSELLTYESYGPHFREDWFDDRAKRGRIDSPAAQAGQLAATTTGGNAKPGQAHELTHTVQQRKRGVDMFQRDPHRTRQPSADDYYDGVDARNLLFGAGISGTTGSLLQAALAFGRLAQGELRKQYVMAIIGYLVGGGMHSYHESMAVAVKAGVEYEPGAYKKSLPATFLGSRAFREWNARYYDISTLGATHWRYNDGCLPSHLNKRLVTATA